MISIMYHKFNEEILHITDDHEMPNTEYNEMLGGSEACPYEMYRIGKFSTGQPRCSKASARTGGQFVLIHVEQLPQLVRMAALMHE